MQAKAKAAHDVQRARLVSLKLQTTIDRSSRAVAAMDRHIAKNMATVLPVERKNAARAWKQAKFVNSQVLAFKKMVSAGRKRVGAWEKKVRHRRAAKEKKV